MSVCDELKHVFNLFNLSNDDALANELLNKPYHIEYEYPDNATEFVVDQMCYEVKNIIQQLSRNAN